MKINRHVIWVAIVLAGAGIALFFFSVVPEKSLHPEDVGKESTTLVTSLPAPEVAPSVPPPAGKLSTTATVTRSASDWQRLYFDTADYCDFVSTAAAAALRGDGRAAYFVRQVLGNNCGFVISLYKRQAAEPGLDPKREFEDSLNKQSELPVHMRQERMALFDRCSRLATENAFVALPIKKEDAYSYKYWDDLAMELNDPLTKAEHAGKGRIDLVNTPKDQKTDVLKRIDRYTQEVLRSKDPQALLALGIGMYPGDPKRSRPGLGLALAACELGADCLFGHLSMKMMSRGISSTDNPNLSFADMMHLMVGDEQFNRAYREAQEVKEMLSRDDWSELEKLLGGGD